MSINRDTNYDIIDNIINILQQIKADKIAINNTRWETLRSFYKMILNIVNTAHQIHVGGKIEKHVK